MASIITDILQSNGGLSRENVSLKVDDLKRKLEFIKLEVQDSLKTCYVDFFPQYVKLDKLIDEINGLSEEYDSLHGVIEKEVKYKMVSSVRDFTGVVEELKRIKKIKSVALSLSFLHHHLEDSNSFFKNNSYRNSVNSLLKFENALSDIAPEDQSDIALVLALRTQFLVRKENLICQLQAMWKERIAITSSLEGKKKYLSIKFNKTSLSEDNIQLLIALKLIKQLKEVLKDFGKQFLDVVCETVLTKIVKARRTGNASFDIVITNDSYPDPSEAFKVLSGIFQFINEELFQLPTTENEEDDVSNSLMQELGCAIGDEFATLVIEKCLKPSVPKQSRQLEVFHKEMLAARDFCTLLQEWGFIAGPNSKLLDFIQQVDALPVNRMTQDLLSRARCLMQKNLYPTVAVGEIPAAAETMNATELNDISVNKNSLSKSSFTFPECQISESLKDLTKLLLDVKEEAKNMNAAHGPRLYFVGRNICELFICVVPTYHTEEIKKLPQQTAIFHNNCMYLAHFLCAYGLSFQSEMQQNSLEIPFTFIDLVPEIRKLGVEAFLAQMRLQKQQLLQLLQEQRAYVSLVESDAVARAEKAIRQCLCQLQLLKKVWGEILPVNVYFKAIGTLFNVCLEEIIIHITSMEDIAADAAAQLDCMFSIWLKQGPDLFKIPSCDENNSVHKYVHSWFKFQELQVVLSASMREVVERWGLGEGPLAAHFTADEAKRMVRALFQNTERRAAALAKIR